MRFLLALAAVVLPASAFAAGTTAIGPCPPGFVEAPQNANGPVTFVEGRTSNTVGCMLAPPLRAAEPAVQPSPFPVRDFRDPMPVDASVLRLVSLNPRSPTELAQQTSTRVLTRTYDDFDRVKTETVPLEDGGTATIRYTYWRNGVRKTMQDTFGRVTFYEYDGKNRLSRVTANQGLPDQHITEYTYWPDDLLKTITAPNGAFTSYGYDRADRVTSIVITRESLPLLSYEYTYDPNGNRLSQVETNGGAPELTTYTYDNRDRLVTVTYPSGASVEYGYDQVSNRTGEIERDPSGTIVSNKTAVFDAINRLTSVTDPIDPSNDATFTYDANGNLRTKTTAAGTETYDYDPRDLMVEARKGTEIVARYAYDAFGRRYLKVSSEGAFTSVVRQYLYDQTSLLHELDSSDLEVAKYEYGGDRLASLARRDEPRRFYHQDALGSVVALSDSAGAVVARYHLDAWGRYRAPSELDASANRFGFTGYLFDQETELYYAKARFYDPEYGRFTSQDSVLGDISKPPSLHRYFYAYANPPRYTDPTGHCMAFDCQDEAIDRMSPGQRAAFDAESDRLHANLWGGVQGFGQTVGLAALGLALAAREGFSPYPKANTAAAVELATFFSDPKGNLQSRYQAMQTEVADREARGDHVGAGRVAGHIVSNDALVVLSAVEGGWAGTRGLARAALSDSAIVVESSTQAPRAIGTPAIELVRNEQGIYAAAFDGGGSSASRTPGMPLALPAGPAPAGLLSSPTMVRLQRDVNVGAAAPPPLALTRQIGTSAGQDAALQADIVAAIAQGATAIRVNQHQLDAAGKRVGINRPDLQYTRPDGVQVHIEYDRPSSGRGLPHANRLLANDPGAVVETKTIE
jgi:RHS repeat-associated protein